jgi:hypothetical protein
MGLTLLQRGLALAAIGILGAVVALAIVEQRKEPTPAPVLPEAVPAPGGGWYEGTAAPKLDEAPGTRTGCGFVVRSRTAGIAHPVLGCGTKLYVEFGSHEVLTQVVSRRVPPGVQFAVTPRVAKLLGLQSTDLVRWRFAAAGD